jgi:hypothetical protein
MNVADHPSGANESSLTEASDAPGRGLVLVEGAMFSTVLDVSQVSARIDSRQASFAGDAALAATKAKTTIAEVPAKIRTHATQAFADVESSPYKSRPNMA